MKKIFLIVLSLNFGVCATTAQPVPTQDLGPRAQSVKGERVEVQLRNCTTSEWAEHCERGNFLSFRVDSVTEEGLESRYGLIPFGQVMSLKVLNYRTPDGSGIAREIGLGFLQQVLVVVLGFALVGAFAGD